MFSKGGRPPEPRPPQPAILQGFGVQGSVTTSPAQSQGCPSGGFIAQDQPLVSSSPPRTFRQADNVSFMEPPVIDITQSAAPIPLVPLDFAPRPPQAFPAVEPLSGGLFPHPTDNTPFPAQPVTHDIVNGCQFLRFHVC